MTQARKQHRLVSNRAAPILLHLGVNYLGRGDDNDMQLDTELVSRRHAKIVVSERDITVHDLDSHNGIFVNGKKVRSERLGAGDCLYLADAWVRIEDAGVADDLQGVHFDESNMVRDVLANEADDPVLHAMNIVYRATQLLKSGGDVRPRMLLLARELTGADCAMLVEKDSSGLSLVHREGTDARANAVLHRAAYENVSLHHNADEGGVMSMPVLNQDADVLGAFFLSADKTTGFSQRNLEFVTTLSHLLGQAWSQEEITHVARGMPTAERVPAAISNLESEALQEQVVVLESEVARAQSAAKESQKKREAESQKLVELQRQLDELSIAERGDGLQKDEKLKALERENATLQSGLQELQSALDEFESRNLALVAEQKASTAAQGEVQALAAQKAQSDAEHQKQMQQDKRTIETLRNEVAAHVASFNSLRDERNSLREERDALQQSSNTQASSEKAMEEERNAWLREREALLNDREARKAESQTLQDELAKARAFEEKADAADRALSDARAKLDAAGAEQDAMVERVVALERLQGLVEEEFAGPTAMRLKALAQGQRLGPSAKAGELLVVAMQLAGFDHFANQHEPETVRETMALFANQAGEKAAKSYGSVAHHYGSTLVVVFDPAGLPQALAFISEMQEIMADICPLKVALDLGSATQVFVGPHACSSVLVGDPLLVTKGALDFAQPQQVVLTRTVRERFASEQKVVTLGLFSIRGRAVPVDLFELLGASS